jgi:glycosyltransferase involved in cell wall biosynthesis
LHNLDRPTGLNRLQSWILTRFERRTTLYITINPVSVAPEGKPAVLIPHGHYRDWFASYARAAPVAAHAAFFGLVRRYKGIDSLITAFHGLPARFSLTIAGKPSPGLAEDLAVLAAEDTRIVLDLHYLSDEELVGVVTRAQFVILPYREMHNSGGVLTALSLDRPVLVPLNAVTTALRDEVGEPWVQQYDGEVTPKSIAAAVESAARIPVGTRPDLSGRDWDDAGRRHVSAYRQAIRARGQAPAAS